ncbi:MAG: hypothetical protein AAB263_17645 [Planctomycetota bacterium]
MSKPRDAEVSFASLSGSSASANVTVTPPKCRPWNSRRWTLTL